MVRTTFFIRAHLERTNDVRMLVFDDSFTMSMSEHNSYKVETSVMRKPFPSHLRIGFDGLLLKSLVLDGEGTNTITLSILNPLTRQNLVIPPLHGINKFTRYGVAYAPVSKLYKVAVALPPESEDSTTEAECCYIFTVGAVNGSWRSVSTAHLSIADKKAFEGEPLTIEGGFIHWIALDNDRVLTMDIEKETIKETPLPINEVDAQPTVFLSAGEYLSFLVQCGEYSWDAWEMKPKTGEWRKLRRITFGAHKSTFEQFDQLEWLIVPLAWLRYPDVLVLAFGDANEPSIFPYNLDTKEMVTVGLPEVVRNLCPIIHKNSLVRF
ncbi:Unknown protein [Striga hermonthica]|uniref:F-box associated beta-propeller type 3 domain-containing protein n=1 Tax=Striga hermonthica TaxID=68872 RepID=A0A9N7MRT3_STRHE|nr:Unknown protein [Striga hermonthica]